MKKSKKTGISRPHSHFADISTANLALLMGIAEKGMAVMSEILRSPEGGAAKRGGEIGQFKASFDYYDGLKSIQENSARTMLWRLEKKGLVSRNEKQYQLTSRGVSIVSAMRNTAEEPEWHWDGKWRIVMFDIPEKRRGERERLRRALLELEYEPMQKSVFVGKRPLAREIYAEVLTGRLRRCVHTLTVGEIDDKLPLNKS